VGLLFGCVASGLVMICIVCLLVCGMYFVFKFCLCFIVDRICVLLWCGLL